MAFEKDYLSFVVCGSKGVGKSSVINSLSGYEMCRVGKSESAVLVRHICTQDDRKLVFYETVTNEEAVFEMYEKCRDADLFLYCIDMRKKRFTRNDIETLRRISAVLGESFWSRCVLVLTKSNLVHVPRHLSRQEYHQMLYTNLLKTFRDNLIHIAGVHKHTAYNISACAAGHCKTDRLIWCSSDKAKSSEERVDFLTELWLMCLERMPIESQDLFLSFTEERMKASTEQALEAKKKYEEEREKIHTTTSYQMLINEAVPSNLPRYAHAKSSDLILTSEHYERLTAMIRNSSIHVIALMLTVIVVVLACTAIGAIVGYALMGTPGIFAGAIVGGAVIGGRRVWTFSERTKDNQLHHAIFIFGAATIGTAVGAGVGSYVGYVGTVVGAVAGAIIGEAAVERALERCDSVQDQIHPIIYFKGRVGRKGAVLSCPGLSLTIPPGAVTTVVDIFIRPCLSGPFVLPDGYEIASPPYLIYPHTRFEKAVELSLDHFMNLESKEDCEEMTFISASAKPVYEHQHSRAPKYKFRIFRKGAFEVGSKKAVVKLKHFCIIATARRKRRNEDCSGGARKKIKYEYSVRLYLNLPPAQDGYVVFSTTLDHKLYIKNLERQLGYNEQFHPPPTCCSVQFAKDKISLILPEVEGYLIIPDISPCTISRHEVDRPLHDLKSLHMPSYPPRRRITIHQQTAVASMQIFELKALGFSEEIKFFCIAAAPPAPSSLPESSLSDSLPHSPASPLPAGSTPSPSASVSARSPPASPPASPASTSAAPAQDTDEPTLGPEHLDQLFKAVRGAKDSWRAVGEALGFTVQDLDECIEHTRLRGGGENNNCFQELLKRWLKRAPPLPFPHVKQLAGALRAVKEYRTAYELERSKEFKGL